MRQVTWILGVLLVTGSFGCRIGFDPGRSVVATSQYGAQIELRFDSTEEYPEAWVGRSVRIELLAVTEEGILVEDGAYIWLFTFGSFRKAEFQDGSGAKSLEGNPPVPERLRVARFLSRYPYGLSEEQLAFLLSDRGQAELIVR